MVKSNFIVYKTHYFFSTVPLIEHHVSCISWDWPSGIRLHGWLEGIDSWCLFKTSQEPGAPSGHRGNICFYFWPFCFPSIYSPIHPSSRYLSSVYHLFPPCFLSSSLPPLLTFFFPNPTIFSTAPPETPRHQCKAWLTQVCGWLEKCYHNSVGEDSVSRVGGNS